MNSGRVVVEEGEGVGEEGEGWAVLLGVALVFFVVWVLGLSLEVLELVLHGVWSFWKIVEFSFVVLVAGDLLVTLHLEYLPLF